MNQNLLSALRQWRDEQARIEGVAGYRVLNTAALEEVARVLPHDRETLCMIKGIKEAKYRRYGKTILALVATHQGAGTLTVVPSASVTSVLNASSEPTQPLSVSQFLDSLNLELSGMAARLRGEVSSLDIRERVVYFSLKDSEDESLLSCLIFRSQYEVSGIALALGDEVIVEGVPDVYKPNGRLSLKVGVIEYAGEGALKKAYDALYRKLDESGVFAAERKRPIPDFSRRIALITSREGAAIGDFSMNLSRAGLQIDFYPTLVEGKRAVFEIIEAIRHFNRAAERYGALVLIRGGGSLESLQAFNTEALVQEIANSEIPVLAGIGHERDVSLAALAADAMVSTPTAAARFLSEPWDDARRHLGQTVSLLRERYQECYRLVERTLRMSEDTLQSALIGVEQETLAIHTLFREAAAKLPEHIRTITGRLSSLRSLWWIQLVAATETTTTRLAAASSALRQYDPTRILRLGYALVRHGDKIVRTARDVAIGDRINIQLGTGAVESEVSNISE